MASQVTCRELHAKNVKLYKVTHGVCTLLEYNSAHKDDLDGTDSLQHAEWRALYTQFQADHVLGTVPYRWEKGHAEAVLIEATLASVDIVEIDGPILHDGSVSGGEKAAAVKEKLGLPAAEPLMEALGRLGKTALVRETEDEWELVVPHALLDKLSLTERVVARFRKHPNMSITHTWRAESDVSGMWHAWVEGSTRPACVTDLDMSWLRGDERTNEGTQGHAKTRADGATVDGHATQGPAPSDDDGVGQTIREFVASDFVGLPVRVMDDALRLRFEKRSPSAQTGRRITLIGEMEWFNTFIRPCLDSD